MNPPTPQQVLDVFACLTGIVFRRVPDTVLRQAADFAQTWTFEELELVIEFTRAQMKSGAVSYNAQSLTWRKLMGDFGATDAFLTFQDRLGVAQDALKRKAWRYRPRYEGNELRKLEKPQPPIGPIPPISPTPAPDLAEHRARNAALVEDLARKLKQNA